MVPVIQAKRNVAVLLNLEHHDVAAQRVNRACPQENGIAGLRSQGCELVRHRPVREGMPQTRCSRTWLQARIDAAFGPGFQHDPCFSLRGLARWQQVGICVGGMHLDREHLAYIEELQQKWESTEASGQLSQHLLWKLLQQLSDGPPFERSVSDAALMV